VAKRAFKRFPVKGSAVCLTPSGRQIFGRANNLSPGGVLLTMNDDIGMVNDLVDLALDLEGCDIPLVLRCRISWMSGKDISAHSLSKIGLQFQRVSRTQAELISKLGPPTST